MATTNRMYRTRIWIPVTSNVKMNNFCFSEMRQVPLVKTIKTATTPKASFFSFKEKFLGILFSSLKTKFDLKIKE